MAKEVLRRLGHPPFTGQLDHEAQVQQLERVRDEGAAEPYEETEARYQAALARAPDDPWLHWRHGDTQARDTLAYLERLRRPPGR